MKSLIVCLIITACTSSMQNQDPPPDSQGSGSGVDASIPTPPGYTDIPVVCTDFVRTTTHTSSDGSKDVVTNSFAFFNFAPGDDFIVQSCQPAPTTPACAPTDACSGSLYPQATTSCSVSHGDGTFLDGKLEVLCGQKLEHYLANGVLQTSNVTTYDVHVEAK